MPRPEIYDWEAIRLAYEKGFSKKEIQDKFKVTNKTLTNKINDNKWEIKGSVDNDIEGIKEKLKETSFNYVQNEKVGEMYLKKVETIIEDNEIIGINRKLVKSFLSLTAKGIREGLYKTPQDIKTGMSTIRDSEAISNPVRQNQEINVNTQNNNINTNIELTKEEAKKEALKMGIPEHILDNL